MTVRRPLSHPHPPERGPRTHLQRPHHTRHAQSGVDARVMCAGVYATIAIACHAPPHRAVSLALVAKAMGAVASQRSVESEIQAFMQLGLPAIQHILSQDAALANGVQQGQGRGGAGVPPPPRAAPAPRPPELSSELGGVATAPGAPWSAPMTPG